METLIIEILDPRALPILYEMEEQGLIAIKRNIAGEVIFENTDNF